MPINLGDVSSNALRIGLAPVTRGYLGTNLIFDTTATVNSIVYGAQMNSLLKDTPAYSNVPTWLTRISNNNAGVSFAARGQFGFLREWDIPPTLDDSFTETTFPGQSAPTTWAQILGAGLTNVLFVLDNFQGPPPIGATFVDPISGGTIPPLSTAIGQNGENSYVNELANLIDLYETNVVAENVTPPDYDIYAAWPDNGGVMNGDGSSTATDFQTWRDHARGFYNTWFNNLITQIRDDSRVSAIADRINLIPISPVLQNVMELSELSSLASVDWFRDANSHGDPVLYLTAAMICYSYHHNEAAPEPTSFDVAGGVAIPADFINNYATIAAFIQAQVNPVPVAPTVVTPVADQSFTENTGVQTVSLAGVFNGVPAPALSLVTPPTGVTINGNTVSIDTDATGVLTGQSITVRATNSAGSVDDIFDLDVAIAAPAGTRTATFGTEYLSNFMPDQQTDSLVITWFGIDFTEAAGSANLLFYKDFEGTDLDTSVALQSNGGGGAIWFNAGGFVFGDTPFPAGVFDLRFTQTHSAGTVTAFFETREGAGTWTQRAVSNQTAGAQNPRDLVIFAGEGGVDPVALSFDGLTVVSDGVTVLDLNPATPALINAASGFNVTGEFGLAQRPSVRATATSNTSIANMPAAQVGDTMFVYLACNGDVAGEPTDTETPAGWTRAAERLFPRAIGAVFHKPYEAGDPATVDFTPPSAGSVENSCVTIAIAMQDVADPTDPIAGTVIETGSSGNTTNHNLGAIDVETRGEGLLAFATGGWGGSFTYTPPTGFTELADLRSVASNSSGCVATAAFLENAPSGITDEAFTNTTGLHYVGMIMRVR